MSSETRQFPRTKALPPAPSANGAVPKATSAGKPSKAHREALGRFEAHTKFLRESARLCNTTEQAVWFALWDRCYGDTTEAVSQNQLAEYLGVSVSTIKRAIKTLTEKRLVSVVHRGHSFGFASTYSVRPTPSELVSSVTPHSVHQ